MVKKGEVRSEVKPKEKDPLSEKPEGSIYSDPIFRLLQNSRRVPLSSVIKKRRLSLLISFALALEKVWSAWLSRRRIKKNLYEDLANTISGIEKDSRETDEELWALKNRIENKSTLSKKDSQDQEIE